MGAPQDARVAEWLAAGADEADAALGRLLAAVRPAIQQVVARAFGSTGRDEAEDACSDAIARLIARLQRARSSPGEATDEIADVVAYAAVTARRVCAEYIRRAHPARARLKCRIRYGLGHDRRLRARADDRGATLGGLAAWRDERGPGSAEQASVAARSADINVSGRGLLDALVRVLAAAGGWMEVDALTGVLFSGARLSETTLVTLDGYDPPAAPVETPDDAAGAGQMAAIWSEIEQLPARQRAALLLNLRDPDGGSALPIVVLSGIATLARIAALLEMPVPDLARLWPSLPLDDLRIAERLGATRQQVINLRKAGRARLARRLASSSGDGVVIPGESNHLKGRKQV